MKNPLPLRKTLIAGMLVALSLAFTTAMAAEQMVHVRGVVTAVSAKGFTVQTPTGMKTIAISAGTHISGVVPSSIDAIQPGSFIGSANLTDGNSAQAQEVVVFPPAMKGSGLGDYPWDLPARDHAADAMTNGQVMSAMTNGTVQADAMHSSAMQANAMSDSPAPRSAMTNGTVKSSSGNTTRSIVVDYGKGQKTIEVAADTPIVTFKPADISAIVKGAHVFVAGKPGAVVSAGIVAVGLDGTVPPM